MKTRLIFVVLFFANLAYGSDSLYVRQIADSLSSVYFWGRGYTNHGMARAANYIATEMKAIGMEVKVQDFNLPVNIFDSHMALSINGLSLKPGIDFLVDPASRPLNAKGALQQMDSVIWVDQKKGVEIKLVDKLTWRVSNEQQHFTGFWVLKNKVRNPTLFEAQVGAKFKPNYRASNVMGIIKGTQHPDSMLVFTAHYDHLGSMGKQVYFAGANDNASGVGFMLGLARYYAKNPAPVTLVFIAFGAEEAGLVGSKYFTENPLINLSKIRLLINFDLLANGEEGITIVNSTSHPEVFERFKKINEERTLVKTVNPRNNAPNSDHYWFTQKGVPAFFIYTLGARKAYHDVDDVRETLPWPKLKEMLQLVKEWVGEFVNDEW